jgi:hypothetical protein
MEITGESDGKTDQFLFLLCKKNTYLVVEKVFFKSIRYVDSIELE